MMSPQQWQIRVPFPLLDAQRMCNLESPQEAPLQALSTALLQSPQGVRT
jgi:hypothetical protein